MDARDGVGEGAVLDVLRLLVLHPQASSALTGHPSLSLSLSPSLLSGLSLVGQYVITALQKTPSPYIPASKHIAHPETNVASRFPSARG